jgi:pimeloyl-ACP methyl ester carboxylesterase
VELGARRPDRTLAVIAVDAIVGAPWDRLQEALRSSPAAMARFTRDFWSDTLGTVPWTEPFQVAKLGWRSARTVGAHVTRPWESMRAGMIVARSDLSVTSLTELARNDVPFVAVHGDDDRIVPITTARDAVARTRGELVVVHGAGHSWMLRCPETLPAIVEELVAGYLGDSLARRGIDMRRRTARELERACLAPGAPLKNYGRAHPSNTVRKSPRYTWDRPAA